MQNGIRKNLMAMMLAASFLGIAVFHLFLMSDSQMMSPHACFGAIAGEEGCPPLSEGASSFSYHLQALQDFLQAIPQHSNNLMAGVFAAVLLLGAALVALFANKNHELVGLRMRFKRLTEKISAFHHQIGFWLKLLEKRDPAREFFAVADFGLAAF